jgi:hypothetical protein
MIHRRWWACRAILDGVSRRRIVGAKIVGASLLLVCSRDRRALRER